MECFYIDPARNHVRESKHVLVRTGMIIIVRNVTWVHVPLSRFPTFTSTLSLEGEGYASGRDRSGKLLGSDVESVGSDIESVDIDSESSGEGEEMTTSEVDSTE